MAAVPTSRILALSWLAVAVILPRPALAGSDPIVVDAPDQIVSGGRYSQFATFQDRLKSLLQRCDRTRHREIAARLEPDGRIGKETRRAVVAALACHELKDVPAGSRAREGAITAAVWRAILGRTPTPDLRERTMALILTFEDTDFGDSPEWGFCRDNAPDAATSTDPTAADFACRNATDPCSFLTWGPRGATAGGGREIQLVLAMVDKRQPRLVESAFGAETANVRRLLGLVAGDAQRCPEDSAVELFMCSVWLDRKRRRQWESGLIKLGQEPLVRQLYERLYSFEEFDGAKLARYYELWSRLGLEVHEVDFAFFMDRITQFGGPWQHAKDDTIAKVAACMATDRRAHHANGKARRCIALLQPHPNQPDDRLARDVAFYIDAYPDGALPDREISAWAHFKPVSAVMGLGLREDVKVALPDAISIAQSGESLPLNPTSEALTEAERTSCPATVRSPLRRSLRK